MHFIHKNKVLHRDITIHNILVFEGSVTRRVIFKIADFGISKDFLDLLEPLICTTQIAHPCFTPPELLLPEYGYTNEQSDLYHIGLVFLYSLTKKLPFDEKMEIVQRNKLIIDGIPRIEAGKIGTPLGDFIAILLRRHQEYRFKTAIEAWHYLQQLNF